MDSSFYKILYRFPNQKSKRYELHEAPLEQWGELETTPFKTIHIDHKGSLRPSSNSKNHCLVVLDAYPKFIGVYQVKETSAQATNSALEKWITIFEIPRTIIHDNGTAFINSDFINWTKIFGIKHAPRATYLPYKRLSRNTKPTPHTILEKLHQRVRYQLDKTSTEIGIRSQNK